MTARIKSPALVRVLVWVQTLLKDEGEFFFVTLRLLGFVIFIHIFLLVEINLEERNILKVFPHKFLLVPHLS